MRNVIKAVMLCFLSALAVNANAALVSVGDQLGVGGTLSTDTGALDTATTVQLMTVDGTIGTGGIDDVFALVGAGGDAASLTSFAPVAGFMSIDGWTLDLSTLAVVSQTTDLLALDGTGTLSKNGDSYGAVWAFSAQSATSYSLDVTVSSVPAVPVPAAVWLFGSGLIGMVGLARRKA